MRVGFARDDDPIGEKDAALEQVEPAEVFEAAQIEEASRQVR